jgi:hypothetical protein
MRRLSSCLLLLLLSLSSAVACGSDTTPVTAVLATPSVAHDWLLNGTAAWTPAVPATNSAAAQGGAATLSTIVSLPADSWAEIIEVQSIALSKDPDYVSFCTANPQTCNASDPLPEQGNTAYPAGVGGGALSLHTTLDNQGLDMRPGDSASERVFRGRLHAGGTVRAVRSGIGGWYTVSPDTTTRGMYALSGSTLVQVRQYVTPSITPSTAPSSSYPQNLTYALNANPSSSGAGWYWFYYGGDTTSVPPSQPDYWSRSEFSACRGQTYCAAAISAPGRVWAYNPSFADGWVPASPIL